MGRYWTGIVVFFCILWAAPEEKKSPHYNGDRCGDCHGRDLPDTVARHGSRKALFIALCRECHFKPATACRFHDGFAPSDEDKKRIDPLLPMMDGKFHCLTCHDARIQCVSDKAPAAEDNPLFLRGNPKGPVSRFCFACHRAERFRYFNVHEHADEACLYCHDKMTQAKGEGKRNLQGKDVKVCRSCHAPAPHPGGKDHTTLQREGTKIKCHTCHDPHEKRMNGKYLLRSKDRETLCRNCHEETPEEKDSK